MKGARAELGVVLVPAIMGTLSPNTLPVTCGESCGRMLSGDWRMRRGSWRLRLSLSVCVRFRYIGSRV